MSVLSNWLSHQGRLGRLVNEAGEAVIPVIANEAEVELEAGLNELIVKQGGQPLAQSITPTVDALFNSLLVKAGLTPPTA